VVGDPKIPYFEYTIMAGCGYVGGSARLIHVRENSEIKFAIEDKSIYVLDDDGKVQQLRYMLQFLPLPPPPVPKK